MFPKRVKPFALVVAACALALCAQAVAFAAQASGERGRAAEMMKSGDYAGAVGVLRQVVKNEGKQDAEAWFALGAAYTGLDEPDEARKAFEKSVKLRDDYAPAHAGLAVAYLNSGRLYDAEHEARRSLGLDPKQAEGNYVLGVVALRRDRFAEALERAEFALRDDPDHPRGLLLKANALVGNALGASGRPAAKNAADKAAEVAERRARLDAAAEALERLLRLKPDARAADEWREELEAVRAYAGAYDPSDPARTVFTGDEVDTKAVIHAKPLPTYTERAREHGTRGVVRVRIVLGADGRVQHPLVVRSLPDGLSELAVAAARKVRFTPAVKDGKPVSTAVMLEYAFNTY
ncbi:MAG TPA: TonB family protein [Pyrinomonadaceae bacterium]|nr:TonB family protein [Pyrinomonadaceae bacterium]